MKIAVPVKTDRENPAVSPLFGKAKYFAFVEGDRVEIKTPPVRNGRGIAEWLLNEGVDTLIMQEMGHAPYEMIKNSGKIKVYHSGYDRVLLSDVIEKLKNGELKEVSEEKMQEIMAHHEKGHSHHGHHHH